jgi:hypothetical protein
MSYDWTGAADGKARAPKIPPGETDLTIIDVIFGSKKAGLFKSNDGDPQIMVIFGDGKGHESGEMITLSDKAAWKLAQLLAASGANLAAMKERGITPAKFTEEQFAKKNLIGRKFRGDVQYEAAANGKDYARVTPLRPEPAGVGADTGAAAESVDDLPV